MELLTRPGPISIRTLLQVHLRQVISPAMKGSIPDTQDDTGRTSLHQAAVKGDKEEVEMLLSGGANPNTQDAHMQTPANLAAERGLEDVVKLLAEHSATDINLQDSFGRTPLHWCAKRCDVKGVEGLLGTGRANINVTTTGGDTALHWASSAKRDDASDRGNLEERSLRVAELLLGAGADLRAKNQRGETPLDLATGNAVMALLLSASQELDKREEEEEAERHRSVAARESGAEGASATISSSSAKPAMPSVSGAGWPGKKSGVGMGFSKKAGVSGAGFGVGGAKKKMVIKLKKKSPE